jgi:hypothetical protein
MAAQNGDSSVFFPSDSPVATPRDETLQIPRPSASSGHIPNMDEVSATVGLDARPAASGALPVRSRLPAPAACWGVVSAALPAPAPVARVARAAVPVRPGSYLLPDPVPHLPYGNNRRHRPCYAFTCKGLLCFSMRRVGAMVWHFSGQLRGIWKSLTL